MDFFTIPTLHATYNLNFKRYEKKLFLAGAIPVMSAAAVVGYKVYNQSRMSAFMKANIEALTRAESSDELQGSCYNNKKQEILKQEDKIINLQIELDNAKEIIDKQNLQIRDYEIIFNNLTIQDRLEVGK